MVNENNKFIGRKKINFIEQRMLWVYFKNSMVLSNLKEIIMVKCLAEGKLCPIKCKISFLFSELRKTILKQEER